MDGTRGFSASRKIPHPETSLLASWKEFELRHDAELRTPAQAGGPQWTVNVYGVLLKHADPSVLLTMAQRRARGYGDETETETEDAEDAAEADAAMDEPGESVPWEQVKAELGLEDGE